MDLVFTIHAQGFGVNNEWAFDVLASHIHTFHLDINYNSTSKNSKL